MGGRLNSLWNWLCCKPPTPTVESVLKYAQKSYRDYLNEQLSVDERNRALELAIDHYGEAYNMAAEQRHANYLAIAINYGAVANKYRDIKGRDATHSTVDILSRARADFRQSEKRGEYPTLLNNLGNALLDRYLEARNGQDLESAAQFFGEVRTVLDDISNPQYSHSLLGSAKVICIQCEQDRAPDVQNLRSAIRMLEQALGQPHDDSEFETLRQLATAHDICYRRTRTTIDDESATSYNLEDLNKAIEYNTRALKHEESEVDNAPCLINLARQEFERHIKRKGDNGVDLKLAEEHLDDAFRIVEEIEGGLREEWRTSCEGLRANIKKYKNREDTVDYGETRPAPNRRSTIASIGGHHGRTGPVLEDNNGGLQEEPESM